MDAAGPLFANRDPSARLDPTDATTVDAIHTDMGSLVLLDLGITQPVGHIDFYPNHGIDQPGCKGKKKDTNNTLCLFTLLLLFSTSQ